MPALQTITYRTSNFTRIVVKETYDMFSEPDTIEDSGETLYILPNQIIPGWKNVVFMGDNGEEIRELVKYNEVPESFIRDGVTYTYDLCDNMPNITPTEYKRRAVSDANNSLNKPKNFHQLEHIIEKNHKKKADEEFYTALKKINKRQGRKSTIMKNLK